MCINSERNTSHFRGIFTPMQIIAVRCQSQPDCLHLYEHLPAPGKPKPCNPHVPKTYLSIDQSMYLFDRCMNCFLHCGGGIVCLVFVSSSRLSFRYISASTTIRIRSQTPPHTILLAWTTKKIKKAYTYYVLQFYIVIRSQKCGMQQGAPSSFVLTRSHAHTMWCWSFVVHAGLHTNKHAGLNSLGLACLLDFKLFRLQLTSDCFSVDFRWCYPYPQLPSDCFYHPRAAAAEERKTSFGGPFLMNQINHGNWMIWAKLSFVRTLQTNQHPTLVQSTNGRTDKLSQTVLGICCFLTGSLLSWVLHSVVNVSFEFSRIPLFFSPFARSQDRFCKDCGS